MKFKSTLIDYHQTGLFSNLVKDYIQDKGTARSFAAFEPNYKGVEASIEQRKKYPVNRKVLVDVLQKQYAKLATKEKVNSNIELLKKENTFVITTAHQPNIFTGPLYFFL